MKIESLLSGLLLLLLIDPAVSQLKSESDLPPTLTHRPFEFLDLGPGQRDGPPKLPGTTNAVASDVLPNCDGSSSRAINRKAGKGGKTVGPKGSSIQVALRSRSIDPGSSGPSSSPTLSGGNTIESGSDALCNDSQPEQSEEKSECTAVAKQTVVTHQPSTTFRMELDVIAVSSKAKRMGATLRQALQSQVAPALTSCAEQGRRLLEGVSNVVFGNLSLEDMRECPDPSGDLSAATCFSATGIVTVYGIADGFAVALSSETRNSGALQVDGLIDIFYCRISNTTDEEPVPEGTGSIVSTTDPDLPSSARGAFRAASSPADASKLPPIAYVGISVAIFLVLWVALMVIRRYQAYVSQVKGGAEDDIDTDSNSEFDTETMKIHGFASVSRGSEEDEEGDYATPIVEKRIIDDDENGSLGDEEEEDDDHSVVIIPIYRFVAALDINPTEDEQSLKT